MCITGPTSLNIGQLKDITHEAKNEQSVRYVASQYSNGNRHTENNENLDGQWSYENFARRILVYISKPWESRSVRG